MKDYIWGRKWMFTNWVSFDESRLKIPLWQLPFAYGLKPWYRCRAIWAWTYLTNVGHTVDTGSEIWRHYRSLEKIYFGQL